MSILNHNYKNYNIIIEKKKIKNTYIRVKDDNTVYVTTNYLTTIKQIEKIIDDNINKIESMIKRVVNNNDYYLGVKYNIIYGNKNEISNNKIIVKDKENLDKFFLNQAKVIFKERLDYNYNLFEEKISYPKLKIRKMKTRWGVCNRKNLSITLNFNLIHYDIDLIDYVIIHELSHLVEFNHSKKFWLVVEKYCKDYKKCRKLLRE